jgi:hypothetical protein
MQATKININTEEEVVYILIFMFFTQQTERHNILTTVIVFNLEGSRLFTELVLQAQGSGIAVERCCMQVVLTCKTHARHYEGVCDNEAHGVAYTSCDNTVDYTCTHTTCYVCV